MTMPRWIACLCASSAALVACGQFGPLYLPGKGPKQPSAQQFLQGGGSASSAARAAPATSRSAPARSASAAAPAPARSTSVPAPASSAPASGPRAL